MARAQTVAVDWTWRGAPCRWTVSVDFDATPSMVAYKGAQAPSWPATVRAGQRVVAPLDWIGDPLTDPLSGLGGEGRIRSGFVTEVTPALALLSDTLRDARALLVELRRLARPALHIEVQNNSVHLRSAGRERFELTRDVIRTIRRHRPTCAHEVFDRLCRDLGTEGLPAFYEHRISGTGAREVLYVRRDGRVYYIASPKLGPGRTHEEGCLELESRRVPDARRSALQPLVPPELLEDDAAPHEAP